MINKIWDGQIRIVLPTNLDSVEDKIEFLCERYLDSVFADLKYQFVTKLIEHLELEKNRDYTTHFRFTLMVEEDDQNKRYKIEK